jgi:hypothetical protein
MFQNAFFFTKPLTSTYEIHVFLTWSEGNIYFISLNRNLEFFFLAEFCLPLADYHEEGKEALQSLNYYLKCYVVS